MSENNNYIKDLNRLVVDPSFPDLWMRVFRVRASGRQFRSAPEIGRPPDVIISNDTRTWGAIAVSREAKK